MDHKFEPVPYESLTARQKENYNFQKISAVLADYGFATIRLSDDWNGADFLALHRDRNVTLRVQLKGRLTFATKYQGQSLWICFPEPETAHWYMCPHDDALAAVATIHGLMSSKAWLGGEYSFPALPRAVAEVLAGYRLRADPPTGRSD